MEMATCYCPKPTGARDGLYGFGNHLVRRGRDKEIPRLWCTVCGRTFSIRHGTAYFDLEVEPHMFTIAMRALAEGNALRGTGRLVGVDKDTVCAWLDCAGRHCRAVTAYLFATLHIFACQLDELWSFVRKKEGHLTPAEKVLALYGDAWVWVAFAPEWRMVVAFVVGKRNRANARLLIEGLKTTSCGCIPSCTSDQLPYYTDALLQGDGLRESIPNPGQKQRKPRSKLLPPPDLLYAQVVKQRQRGRLVKVLTKVIFGSEGAVQDRLAMSKVSQAIHTSFVARQHLTCRQCNGRLARKVLRFSKDLTWLEKHLWLTFAYYHFVLPHASLAQPLPASQSTRGAGSLKKRQSVTPAMAAGMTDHIWTMEELLSYRVPPDFRDKLVRQECTANQ